MAAGVRWGEVHTAGLAHTVSVGRRDPRDNWRPTPLSHDAGRAEDTPVARSRASHGGCGGQGVTCTLPTAPGSPGQTPGPVHRARRRASDWRAEHGFTLIEVTIALGLLGIALVPVTGMVLSGLKAATTANHISDAMGVATGALSQAQAVPYGQIGFYANQTGYVASYGGQPTVTLGSTVPPNVTPPLSPVSTQTVGNTSFTVDLYITWANAAGPTTNYPEAYKLVTAVVSWATPLGGTTTYTEHTIVYPGGLGSYAGPAAGTGGGNAGGAPQSATITSATVPAAPAGQGEIDVTWSTPSQPGYYVVEWSTQAGNLPAADATNDPPNNGTVQASPHQPATATSYAVQGLTPGTTYWIEVLSYSTDGTQWASSNEMSATTLSSSSGCQLVSFTVSGATSGNTSKTYLNNNGTMSENLNLVLSAAGSCSGTTYTVAPAPGSSATDPGSPYTLTAVSSTQWTATVLSSGQAGWVTGEHSFELYAGGTQLSPPVAQSFLVCAWTPPGQRSSSSSQC